MDPDKKVGHRPNEGRCRLQDVESSSTCSYYGLLTIMKCLRLDENVVVCTQTIIKRVDMTNHAIRNHDIRGSGAQLLGP